MHSHTHHLLVDARPADHVRGADAAKHARPTRRRIGGQAPPPAPARGPDAAKHARPTRRRTGGQAIAAALAIITVWLLAAAPRADAWVNSTGLACNYDGVSYNACFSLQYAGFFWWTDHVGIDVR